MFESIRSKRTILGFTLMEVLIGVTILSVLFTVVYQIFSGVMGSFDTNQWKMLRQKELKISSRFLKTKIQAATYPTLILFKNADPNKNGLFSCSEAFYRSAASEPPNYATSPGDGPGPNECVQYLGDNGAVTGAENAATGFNDMTYSTIYRVHSSGEPTLDDNYKYPSINGKFNGDGAVMDAESIYKNLAKDSGSYNSSSSFRIMSFLMCKPRKDIDAGLPAEGLVRVNLKLNPCRSGKDRDGADLVCEEVDVTAGGNISLKKTNLISNIYKIEIAHRLLPNDPPLGDFIPNSASSTGYQFFCLGASGASIKSLATYYRNNNPADGLTADAEKYCAQDMRRGSIITMRFYMRPFRKPDARGGRNILLVEEIEEKTNVRAIDNLL